MNTQYTDTQLKQALAKMLPEEIEAGETTGYEFFLKWKDYAKSKHWVKDTELLHLCWLVEQELQGCDFALYGCELADLILQQIGGVAMNNYVLAHASWQQRTIALAKVKGVEI